MFNILSTVRMATSTATAILFIPIIMRMTDSTAATASDHKKRNSSEQQ